MTSALFFFFFSFSPLLKQVITSIYLFIYFTFAIQDSCYIILKTQLRMNMLEVVVMLNNPPPLFIYFFKPKAGRNLAVLLWIRTEEDLDLSPAYGDHNS